VKTAIKSSSVFEKEGEKLIKREGNKSSGDEDKNAGVGTINNNLLQY